MAWRGTAWHGTALAKWAPSWPPRFPPFLLGAKQPRCPARAGQAPTAPRALPPRCGSQPARWGRQWGPQAWGEGLAGLLAESLHPHKHPPTPAPPSGCPWLQRCLLNSFGNKRSGGGGRSLRLQTRSPRRPGPRHRCCWKPRGQTRGWFWLCGDAPSAGKWPDMGPERIGLGGGHGEGGEKKIPSPPRGWG